MSLLDTLGLLHPGPIEVVRGFGEGTIGGDDLAERDLYDLTERRFYRGRDAIAAWHIVLFRPELDATSNESEVQ